MHYFDEAREWRRLQRAVAGSPEQARIMLAWRVNGGLTSVF
jgi:hypothetical protein